jgi:hypothetical protein
MRSNLFMTNSMTCMVAMRSERSRGIAMRMGVPIGFSGRRWPA